MSFVKNDCQQLTINDSYIALSDRQKRFLKNSWAEYFADHIFPNIKEAPFSVLYSTKASRPNTPVNILVGALLLKEYHSK